MTDGIVRLNLALTALFAATAIYAAVRFTTAAQWVGAVTAMGLFTVGVAAFLWSYWTAVQRSRTDEIAVTQLYVLMGDAIPAPVRRVMNATLFSQFAIALATTLARPNGPEGSPGSSLALGFLVPMLGFGLNGMWASRHGNFATRVDVPPHEPKIGQNTSHG